MEVVVVVFFGVARVVVRVITGRAGFLLVVSLMTSESTSTSGIASVVLLITELVYSLILS